MSLLTNSSYLSAEDGGWNMSGKSTGLFECSLLLCAGLFLILLVSFDVYRSLLMYICDV